jgi:hypothetical protein
MKVRDMGSLDVTSKLYAGLGSGEKKLGPIQTTFMRLQSDVQLNPTSELSVTTKYSDPLHKILYSIPTTIPKL